MIKAIIFDCFGVLAETSPDQFFTTFLSDKPAIVKDIKDLDNRVSTNGISHQEFIDYVVNASGYDASTVEKYTGKNSQNTKLFEFISTSLKREYKIGFLSNAPGDWTSSLFTQEQLSLFDDLVLSFQTGVRKPDPAIFKLAAKRLGVLPAECVMVDDVQVYLDGAERAGLNTILYSTFEQFSEDIQRLL